MEFHSIKSGLHDSDKQNTHASNYLFDFFNQYKTIEAIGWIFSLIKQHSSFEAKSAWFLGWSQEQEFHCVVISLASMTVTSETH